MSEGRNIVEHPPRVARDAARYRRSHFVTVTHSECLISSHCLPASACLADAFSVPRDALHRLQVRFTDGAFGVPWCSRWLGLRVSARSFALNGIALLEPLAEFAARAASWPFVGSASVCAGGCINADPQSQSERRRLRAASLWAGLAERPQSKRIRLIKGKSRGPAKIMAAGSNPILSDSGVGQT